LQLTSKQLSQDNPTEKTILIIGAGVGGLALASRIASSINDHSHKVLVLEKNAEGGGRCGSSYVEIPNIGTFRHERGPSLLLLPQVYRELFKDCGESTPEQYGLTITPCVPAYRVIFSDGDTVDVGFPAALSSNSTNEALLSRKKLDSIEPNGAERWDSYMEAMGAFLDCGLPNFIQEELELSSLPAFLYQALKDGGKVSKTLLSYWCGLLFFFSFAFLV
jgi:phytoene desaturase (3,4-didehydrolycopene-forming)